MTLNKYTKFTYDGYKIVKIGQQELYSYVYKRTWDLNYDVLKKYSLEPKEYIYVGQSSETYLSDRTAKWKNNIENKHGVNKYILEFIDSLKRFYQHELKYSESIIDRIIIPKDEIVCRCENKEIALKKEKEITGKYYLLSILEPSKYVLLSDKDSYFKITNNNGCHTLKIRD